MLTGFIDGMILIAITVAILLFIFWIKMIIDCAKRDFKGDSEKVVWILVIVLLGFLGAIIYYFAVKANDKKVENKKSKKK